MDSGTVTLISLAMTTIGGIVLAYIAFKTAQLGKKVDDVKRQTDGITSALVATTAKAARAEGKLEGKEEEKASPT